MHKIPRDAAEWILHLQEMLTEMRDTALINQQHKKEYSKHRHDIEAKERYFEIGDKVLVFSPVITRKCSEKLCDRWQGPYSVIGKVSTVIYLVDMPERHKRHRTVHIEAMNA